MQTSLIQMLNHQGEKKEMKEEMTREITRAMEKKMFTQVHVKSFKMLASMQKPLTVTGIWCTFKNQRMFFLVLTEIDV